MSQEASGAVAFGWKHASQSVRPQADGRRSAVFVFNELRADAGRLTRLWLARLRAFDEAGWATHAALINRDPELAGTVAELRTTGRFPRGTRVHHFAQRDRRIRPQAWATPAAGESLDPVVANWLDWLTEHLPGAVVFVDSPAAYPYVAAMGNPLVSKVAGVHLNHLMGGHDEGSNDVRFTPRFAERFAPVARAFDAVVVMTAAQAADLRTEFGAGFPVVVLPPAVPEVAPAVPGERDEAAAGSLIVSVGELAPGARHSHVIRALPSVCAEIPEARLQIHGSGPLLSALQHLAREMGVADRVAVVPAGSSGLPFAAAALAVWAGKRESTPLSLVRALGSGVPVVAYDVPYGPAQLVEPGRNGLLVAEGDVTALGAAIVAVLRDPSIATYTADQAASVARAHQDSTVWPRWIELAASLEDGRWRRTEPIVLTSAVTSTDRIFRLPGVLVNSRQSYQRWSVELPLLTERAGFLSDPLVKGSWNDADRELDLAGNDQLARGIIVHLRSNALAYVVINSGHEHKLELTDGAGVRAPLLSYPFAPVLLASKVGNALLVRNPDATVSVRPTAQLVYAETVDGRVHARPGAQSQPTDVTHALSWLVDVDWADLRITPDGAEFAGTLRAEHIAPHANAMPAICVRDAGGYSRVVGQLEFRGEPTIEQGAWQVAVGGVIRTDPLVATTQIARGALALHVGLRGLLHPVGGLWTHGRRASIHLICPRGSVTLLPSPNGRVLAAPGRGVRARTLGLARSLVGRG